MAMSLSDAQLDEVVDTVKELFAQTFVGFTIATTLYGVSAVQVCLYYRNHPSDGPGLKITVALLWILDTLCTLFMSHSIFTYWIFNFMKSPTVDLIMPWSFTAEKFVSLFIVLIAQCFYARTIWNVSESFLMTSVVGNLAVVTFGLGIGASVRPLQHATASSTSARSSQVLSGMAQGLAAFNDMLIAVCLCFWLFKRRKGAGGGRWGLGEAFGRGKVLDTLVLYIVCTGIATALAQLIFLALSLRYTDETYWVPWHQAVGKLYVNSVFAILNMRRPFAPKDNLPAPSTNLSFGDMHSRHGESSGSGLVTDGTGVVGSPQGNLKSLDLTSAVSGGVESVDRTRSTRAGEREVV
ncbi:hypothetical protein GGX14DRAFT_634242 [Mycena pura]|uniref:DUF6534 domain-containing protein n=1 Tax=Mycena pura TaxID=153505 RepID=A0AAD6VEU7_9AGAR|nr:hypothetical protein GGX14DRAFT_634242 [Mycena pura]